MKEHKKSTIVIAYIFVSIVILLLTYILIVAYSYDDIGSKYNTDWYYEKYNISFTSSNKLFPYGQPHCFNTYVDGNKVDFKMDNNSGSISIGKESVFAGKETGEKYSDFDNYASGQYDYYHGVLNVKINKMDNAEYNYLKGKTLAFIKK